VYGFGKKLTDLISSAAEHAICILNSAYTQNNSRCKYREDQFRGLNLNYPPSIISKIIIVNGSSSSSANILEKLKSRFSKGRVYTRFNVLVLNPSWRWQWNKKRNFLYMLCAFSNLQSMEDVRQLKSLSECV
jgi:hypothetical protein